MATLNSDADHTGQLHEAAVPLAQPLAPGASLQLDVTYSGAIAASAQRLLAIGTPEDVALHSDWDQIDTEFTGLRGFGNVVWYPVSAVPVILGDGARLFDEMGEHKLRLAGARIPAASHHRVSPRPGAHGGPHQRASRRAQRHRFGRRRAQTLPVSPPRNSTTATLGFEAPSLFVAMRKAHPGANLTAWTLPDNEVAVQSWTAAAATVTPFLQGWLGQRPRAQLTLLDLPDPQDAPLRNRSAARHQPS